MKKKLCITAGFILLSGSLLADSGNLSDSIKNGQFSGDVTLYGEMVDFDDRTVTDAAFAMGSVGLNYNTERYMGVQIDLGIRANGMLSEKEDGDYYGFDDNGNKLKNVNVAVGTANISYENESFSTVIGRQELDYEWIGDFHEAALLSLSAIPDTVLSAGYSQRFMEVNDDSALYEMEKMSEDGIFFADIKYEGIPSLMINPYAYHVPDLAQWYGLILAYDEEIFGATVHGATSNEEISSTEDGSIYHIEGRAAHMGVSLALGYITTDSDGAIGSMDLVGDNINPLEDGNQVYTNSANTFYGSIEYEYDAFTVGAMYGNTTYDSSPDTDLNEGELDLTLAYTFTDALSAELLYANVNAENDAEDYDKTFLKVAYTF